MSSRPITTPGSARVAVSQAVGGPRARTPGARDRLARRWFAGARYGIRAYPQTAIEQLALGREARYNVMVGEGMRADVPPSGWRSGT